MNTTEFAEQNTPGPAGSTADEVSLLDLCIILAARKRFIAQVTVSAAVLALVVALCLPNQYTAETVLLPPAQNSSLSGALMNQLGGGALASLAGSSLGIKSPGDMYVALLHVRTVEDAVIQRFGLKERYRQKTMLEARKALENHAEVTLGVKDGLIRIDVRDKDAKLAADIANGYVEEFCKLNANLAIGEAAQRRLFFQQQLVDAKDNLAKAEEALKQTEQTTGVLQVDSQAKSLIEAAATLRAQIVAKQVQIQGMKSFATDDNPELVMARQQLAALQAQQARLGGNEQEPDSFVLPKGRVPEAGLEYVRRYRDVKYYETIYELLAKQFEVAKLDEARQGAVIQVADTAIPPDRKSSPHRALITLVAGFAALVFSVMFVLLQHALEQARGDEHRNQQLLVLRKLMLGRN